MEEIEIKLEYKNKNNILKILNNLKAKPKEKFELHDIYFGKKDSMSNKNSLIRIREKGKNTELTFKGECEAEGHIWKRIELTTKIEKADVMAEILINIGLKRIKENLSFRETYELEGLEICFIDFSIPTKLSLIELEGNKEKINKLLLVLGDKVKQIGEDFFKKFDKK